MNGRLFKISHIENQTIEVQASFGGLLFRLVGEQSQLDALQADMRYVVILQQDFLRCFIYSSPIHSTADFIC